MTNAEKITAKIMVATGNE